MTGRPVVPRKKAERDVEQAVDEYVDAGGEAVALGFIEALEAAYAFIAAYPEAGSLRYAYELDLPGLRTHRVRNYPFIVFYLPCADHVDVWRVLHARRDIPVWMSSADADEGTTQ